MGDWAGLPDIVLAQIFNYLPVVDRVCIGNVCTAWGLALHRPEAWKIFFFAEEDLSSEPCEIFDVLPDCYSQEELPVIFEPEKKIPSIVIATFIKDFGRHFRHVKIFFRSRASNQILSSIAENCRNIRVLKIERRKGSVQVVRNHDSSCMTSIKTLLKQNAKLQKLEVCDIDNLSFGQQKDLLPFGATHAGNLTNLALIQSFQSCNLGSLMYLVRLRELAIEPHLLSYSLLYHLAGKSLRDLHIVSVSKHIQVNSENLQNWHWKEIKKQGPNLRVHCHFGSSYKWVMKDIILKEEMPVVSLKYFRHKLLNYPELYMHVCKYTDYLVEFIDFSMSQTSYELGILDMSKSSHINFCLLTMMNACPHLRMFIVKEKVFCSTIVAALLRNKNINFILSERQVITQVCVPDLQSLAYTLEDAVFIQASCWDLPSFESAVFNVTGNPWRFYSYGQLLEIMLSQFLKFM